MNFQGKVAVVTGGASGLGLAAAQVLISRGVRVVVFDRDTEAGEQVVRRLGAQFAQFMQLDVSDAVAAEQAIEYVISETGGIDICLNCAGIGGSGSIVDHDGEPHALGLFRKVIEVNLVGTFNISRCVAAAMMENKPDDKGERGVIINTASIAAFEGQSGQCAYSASKGGVVSMTLPMARDLARSGIRVNTIAPGVIATPLMLGMPQKVRDHLASDVLFPQRMGEPQEFGQLVAHIIENSYINAETIRMDGGLRMQPN